jgi:hypothetical protein
MNKLAWSASLLLGAASMAVPAAGAAPRMAYPGEPRTIEKTFPAESLQRISVTAGVGKIEVSGGAQNQVTLHLELTPKRFHNGWLGRSEEGDPNDAELVAETHGDELRLDLDVKGDRDGLEENWTLTVPARLRARLQVNVGDLDVRDLSGGLELQDNVGNITAEVPEGDIDARVSVGDIRVTSATPSYGDVSLESNVGDVHIEMKDHTVDYPKPAGAGNRISLHGPGKDRMSLRTNVGDARLILRSTV